MSYSRKKKIVSLLLTLCIIGSMFSLPMIANAVAPTYPASATPTIQVASPDFTTFPAAAGSTAANPKTVFVVTSTPGQTINPAADFTVPLTVMDSSFTYTLNATINSCIGTYDVATGSYTGGTVFYAKVADLALSATYYYKVVAFSPASTDTKIASVTDATDLQAAFPGPISGASSVANIVAANTITVNLISGKTSMPQTAIAKNDGNSTFSVWTDTACSVAAPSNLVAGTYYIKVIAQDNTTTAYFKLIVNNAASTDTKLVLNPKTAIVSGNSTTVSNLGSVAAATTYVALPAGTYIISNLNGELFSKDDASETITSVKTTLNANAQVTTNPVGSFSQTLVAGDKFKIDIVVTPASGPAATHTIIYRIYNAAGIYSIGSGMPTGTTCDLAQFTNDPAITAADVDMAHTIAIALTLPVGTNTIASLKDAFNYAGYSIDFSTDNTFADATKVVTGITAPIGAPTVVYARIRTNALDAVGPATYMYYTLSITRGVDANIVVSKTSGSSATVTDNANVSISNTDTSAGLPNYNSKFDTSAGTLIPDASILANAFTIKVTVNSPAKLRTILSNLSFTTAGAAVTPTYTNILANIDPYLSFGDSAIVNVTVPTEQGAIKFFTVKVYVVANSTSAVISAVASSLGTTTLVAGNLDPSTPSVLAITAPKAVTSIDASAFSVADYGTFRLFANQSDVTDNTKAVSSIAVASATNSATAYASVTSGNGAIVKYYEIIVNKTDATAQYRISAPASFSKVGSNYVATVTIDRTQAAKLSNPKLYVVYTLADGTTQTYQTLDLTSSDTTTTKDIVVSAGFKKVMAFVVNNNVDWSQGLPDNQSNMITVNVPVQ